MRELRVVKTKVVVVGESANGYPEFFTREIELPQMRIDAGQHYDIAKAHARDVGIEPWGAFDVNDAAAKELVRIASWLNS